MGYIVIQTAGSFPAQRRRFDAIHHGHADAVAQAIEWLSAVALPAAIAQDHALHDEGARPAHGFDRGQDPGRWIPGERGPELAVHPGEQLGGFLPPRGDETPRAADDGREVA